MHKLIFSLLLLFLVTNFSLAQKGWEIGAGGGVSHYFGDLNPGLKIVEPHPSGHAFARFNFNNRVGIKFGANYLAISGNDANSDKIFNKSRNLSFRSNVFDGLAQIDFNFLPYIHGSRQEYFSPYVFAGMTVFKFNPRAFYDSDNDGENDKWADLNPLATEGQFLGEEYNLTQFGLVYGLGWKLNFNFRWSMEFELSSRFLYTDYLDDVSTVYPEMDNLESLHGDLAVELSDRSDELPKDFLPNPVGIPGRQRGNSANNDVYAVFNISVVYFFGQIPCPEISYK